MEEMRGEVNCFIEDDFIYLRKYISQKEPTFASFNNRTFT